MLIKPAVGGWRTRAGMVMFNPLESKHCFISSHRHRTTASPAWDGVPGGAG